MHIPIIYWLIVISKESVDAVLKLVDKANGYLYGGLERRQRAEKLLYNLENTQKLENDYTR